MLIWLAYLLQWCCNGFYIGLLCSILRPSIIISDTEKSWAQILSTQRSSCWVSITSFLIKTQITCFRFFNNFQEHKLRVYIKNLETILLLSILLYSMAKCVPLQQWLKYCELPQTSWNNILYSCENSQSISRFVVVKFNTSCNHFFRQLLCMMNKVLKINNFLVSWCITFNFNIAKVWHFLSFKCEIKYC